MGALDQKGLKKSPLKWSIMDSVEETWERNYQPETIAAHNFVVGTYTLAWTNGGQSGNTLSDGALRREEPNTFVLVPKAPAFRFAANQVSIYVCVSLFKY